jgi:hypothetical protein
MVRGPPIVRLALPKKLPLTVEAVLSSPKSINEIAVECWVWSHRWQEHYGRRLSVNEYPDHFEFETSVDVRYLPTDRRGGHSAMKRYARYGRLYAEHAPSSLRAATEGIVRAFYPGYLPWVRGRHAGRNSWPYSPVGIWTAASPSSPDRVTASAVLRKLDVRYPTSLEERMLCALKAATPGRQSRFSIQHEGELFSASVKGTGPE